jgi:hypothetical protein
MEIPDDDGIQGSVVPGMREGNESPGGISAEAGEAPVHGVPCDERVQDVKWTHECLAIICLLSGNAIAVSAINIVQFVNHILIGVWHA